MNRLAMIGMVAVTSMPMVVVAQVREFGAVLQGAGSSTEAQVLLTLDESAGTFSMVLLATGFTPGDVLAAAIQDALGVDVFDMLGAANIDQGGNVLSLDFSGQAVPSPLSDFVSQLEDGLFVVVVTLSQGNLEGALIEGGSGGDGSDGGGSAGAGGGDGSDGSDDGGDDSSGDGSNTGGNSAPQADAVADPTVVTEGERVTLDATGSTDADGDELSFEWTQVTDAQAPLTGANLDVATFLAPMVDGEDVELIYRVTVKDGRGGEATAEVTVTVQDSPDDGPGQSTPDDDSDDSIGDDLMPPPCGVCGPVGVVSYFGLLVGWLGLWMTKRRS